MNRQLILGALATAALVVPAAAGAQPHADKPKKAKKVTFVFKGTFTAPGTIEVLGGNAHVRKGGFVGQAVTFDFANAKVVAADTNADQKLDVTDVLDGDRVLVQARIAKGTDYAAGGDAVTARKLVDKTHPPVEDEESGD
jgi:ABC-type amino acid transport substrate-binding protein